MHKLTCSPRRTAALAVALLTATALQAQKAPETAPSTNFPPIVVLASRTGRTAAEIPAHVQVINAEEIAKSGCLTTVDVLEKRAGLFLRKMNANPTLSQVSMRGFGENSFGRVLILVNGERLNNPDMSSPNLARIPVNAISRIEVIRGDQTVLYGDYASAGVINIITDDTEAAPMTTVSASAGSYDTYSMHIARTGTFDDGVTYRANSDWERSGGYRDNGDYEVWGISTALKKVWAEDRFVSLSTFYNDAEYGMPGSLTWQEYKDTPRMTKDPHNRVWQESWGVNVGGRTTADADGYIEANVIASKRKTYSKSVFWGTPCSSAYDTDLLAFTPRYVRGTPVFGHDNRFILGSDIRHERSDVAVLPWSQPYEFDRSSYSGYVQNEFFLTEQLSVLLGARIERFYNHISSVGNRDRYDNQESAYEATLLYRPTENIKTYARVSRFYHAPFIDETVTWGVPNPDLTPETGYALEAGTELTLAKEWSAAFAVYQMDMQKEIFCNPFGQNVNSPDDTRRQGADATLRWSRENVAALNLTYSYVYARFSEGAYDGNAVPMVPRQTVNLNGEVFVADGLAVLGCFRYISKQYQGGDFDNAWAPMKPYGLIDCALRYEPSCVKGLRLIAGVDNIFDKQYCDYAFWQGYYPAVGRTWKLSASYSF